MSFGEGYAWLELKMRMEEDEGDDGDAPKAWESLGSALTW